MYIKTANTEGEYQCIIVGHNNLIQVDKREGYEAIYGPGFFMVAFHVDSIHPDFDCVALKIFFY